MRFSDYYFNINGKLVQNKERVLKMKKGNGIIYISNPRAEDFLKLGAKPKKDSYIPDYDPETEYLEETFTDGGNFWNISYIKKTIEKEV